MQKYSQPGVCCGMAPLPLFLLCFCFVCPCLGITCAPGQKRVYNQDKCEPCEDNYFQPLATSSIFCDLCSDCRHEHGSEFAQQCTKTEDAKCRCLRGFRSVNEMNNWCQCPEGSGLTNTDSGVLECQKCAHGYFTSKPDTQCVRWKDCAPWGVKVAGSGTSDVVCNNGSEVTQTAALSTAANLNYSLGALTTAETSPTTTAAAGSSLTLPLGRTATTATTKRVNDTNYSLGALTTAETSPTTTAAAGSSLTLPLGRTATTATTKRVNDTNYSSGLVFYVLSLILLIPLSAVSCKQVIIPCMKRHLKKMNKTDGACRRPVEECGDTSLSSLVKSSQGVL